MLLNDIKLRYHVNCLKYTNNIPAHFLRHLLFNMKPDTICISISGITDLQLYTRSL